MRGLYVLTSPFLKKHNMTKLVSLRLQSRIFDYITYYSNSSYYSCWQFPDDHSVCEIMFFEQLILKHTINFHNDEIPIEFRYMDASNIDDVVRTI